MQPAYTKNQQPTTLAANRGASMTDYRTMFDSDFVGAWDLPEDRIVTIARVEPLQVGKEKKLKPIVHFAEPGMKPLVCNKTNAKAICAMYGNYVEAWIGKKITIFRTQTDSFGEIVDCIRVRPGMPLVAEQANGR